MWDECLIYTAILKKEELSEENADAKDYEDNIKIIAYCIHLIFNGCYLSALNIKYIYLIYVIIVSINLLKYLFFSHLEYISNIFLSRPAIYTNSHIQ